MTGILYAQSNELKSIQIESKKNGIIISMAFNSSFDFANITGWQANSGWFYITLYKSTGDSTSLSNRELPQGIKEFQVIESAESIQLGLKIIEPIEQFDFSLGNGENAIEATLLYSTTYLAGLETIKQMNLDSHKKLFPEGVRNWFYLTGTGLTFTGLMQDADNRINTQTKAGVGLLIVTFLMDKILSYL